MAEQDKDHGYINKLVASPSIGAIIYEVLGVREELRSFNDEEYPIQACVIRNVFLCIVEHALQQLTGLISDEVIPGTTVGFNRARKIAAIVRSIHAYVRYLRSSSPQQTPPGIQLALSELTTQFFPTEKLGTPICLVRPQWQYNLTYVPLSRYLDNLFFGTVDLLGIKEKFGIDDHKKILPALWKEYHGLCPTEPRVTTYPAKLAVLSFAGMDTHDVLLYPILAHELGHFIDFSYDPPLHETAGKISESDIVKALGSMPVNMAGIKKALNERFYVSLREILADLLGIRMMGLGFFAAHTEFSKSTRVFEYQHTILPSGYPGLRLRISTMLRHLLALPDGINIRKFLEQNKSDETVDKGEGVTSGFLLKYLAEWEAFLDAKSINADEGEQQNHPLELLLLNAVTKTIPILEKFASEIIPDEKCAKLEKSFFKRIKYLCDDMPPSCSKEGPGSFPEIMSAAWAYQFQFGEKRERDVKGISPKSNEYAKTCRLVLKAIELLASAKQGIADSIDDLKTLELPTPKTDLPGVLGKNDILRRVATGSLGIIPFQKSSLQCVSITLHLGHWFSVARRTRLKCFEIGEESSERLLASLAREEIFVQHGKKFLLHPGDLVLGVTLEFVALPPDLMAYVEGKSRIGRTGLIIATASKVDPGFHGGIVLELANVGTVPLEVRPGSLIGQLVFHRLPEPLRHEDLYRGEFYCQIKA